MSDQCQDEIDLTLNGAEGNAPEDFFMNILTYNNEKDWFILDTPDMSKIPVNPEE